MYEKKPSQWRRLVLEKAYKKPSSLKTIQFHKPARKLRKILNLINH
jgi:hypothetical protein